MAWTAVTMSLGAITAAPLAVAQPVARGFAAAPDVSMRLYVPAGTLRVEPWDRDSIHLAGTLGANASLFGGGARTHIKLGVEARTSTDGTIPVADLVVHVPRRARVWIKMIDGTMTVRGLRQELEAYTVRGRVEVRDVAGSTTIESIDAPVLLTDATGDVRVRGSRGTVRLERVDATLSVSTVSGRVELVRSLSEGRIETVGGAIAVDGVRAGGLLELQSHGGAVLVTVDAQRAPLLDLSSRQGVVQPPPVTGKAQYGRITARSFKGDVTVQVNTKTSPPRGVSK